MHRLAGESGSWPHLLGGREEEEEEDFFRRGRGGPESSQRGHPSSLSCGASAAQPYELGEPPSTKSLEPLAGMRYIQKLPSVPVNLANSSSSRAHTHACLMSQLTSHTSLGQVPKTNLAHCPHQLCCWYHGAREPVQVEREKERELVLRRS